MVFTICHYLQIYMLCQSKCKMAIYIPVSWYPPAGCCWPHSCCPLYLRVTALPPSPAAQSRYHRLLHKRLSHSCWWRPGVHWTLCRAHCWHILTHSVSDIMSNVTLAYCPQPTCNLDHDSKIINIELLTIDNVNMSITLLCLNKIWYFNVLASAVHILKLERYRED